MLKESLNLNVQKNQVSVPTNATKRVYNNLPSTSILSSNARHCGSFHCSYLMKDTGKNVAHITQHIQFTM